MALDEGTLARYLDFGTIHVVDGTLWRMVFVICTFSWCFAQIWKADLTEI